MSSYSLTLDETITRTGDGGRNDFELFADLSSFSPFAGFCSTFFVASFSYRCS